jgi:hypothetical protein
VFNLFVLEKKRVYRGIECHIVLVHAASLHGSLDLGQRFGHGYIICGHLKALNP